MEILKLPTGQIRQPGLILRNSLADKAEQDFACRKAGLCLHHIIINIYSGIDKSQTSKDCLHFLQAIHSRCCQVTSSSDLLEKRD